MIHIFENFFGWCQKFSSEKLSESVLTYKRLLIFYLFPKLSNRNTIITSHVIYSIIRRVIDFTSGVRVVVPKRIIICIFVARGIFIDKSFYSPEIRLLIKNYLPIPMLTNDTMLAGFLYSSNNCIYTITL